MRAMHEDNSFFDGRGADSNRAYFSALATAIKTQALTLGFSAAGIAPARVCATAGERLKRWLALGRHGEMDYMAKHAALRDSPPDLMPGTLSVVSLRLPYWPQRDGHGEEDRDFVDEASTTANISRYARGRDYHKVIRSRVHRLADFIAGRLGENGKDIPFKYRVFADSAPVMESEFAQSAGIAWRGKHTLTLTRGGSWHFIGEMFTNLPLPADPPAQTHCGRCRRCLDACPTAAIVAPYELDARRCISYLTIELRGTIPIALRPLIGNRIYGCDDCQLVCPWNRFTACGDPAFAARENLTGAPLNDLFAWSRQEFETRLAGSPIRRIGHERWLRNIAVAIGNASPEPALLAALQARQDDPSPLVREHVEWAIGRQRAVPVRQT